MDEPVLKGAKNRILSTIGRNMPGARSLRVYLHRARGIKIGKNVFIGEDVLLETQYPELITIGNNVIISMRVTIIAHFRGLFNATIEDDVFIGPGAIILPNVTIGRGAVVTAGSVVSTSVPEMTIVQGNPAVAIAKCGVPLTQVSYKKFLINLRPL